MKNKVKSYFNSQIEINKKDVYQNISHLNSNHMNIHKLVMKNTPRSDLQFERVDGIGYRMTKSPNYVGGIHKKPHEFQKNKKACINMKNNDIKSLWTTKMWSIRAYLHPVSDRNVDRLSKYKKYENELNFKGIANFPKDIQGFQKFENKHNIKICLFKISKNKVVTAHIRKTKIHGKINKNVV